MLDVKNIDISEIDSILKPCIGYVKLVRFAINPEKFKNYGRYITKVKELGFEVALNFMYFSNWINDFVFVKEIVNWSISNKADFLYFVDSYGSVFPEDIDKLFVEFNKPSQIKLGFHAHDNLSLAFANTLCALKYHFDIIDSTMLGMGRGAGNLKTELILQYKKKKLDLNLLNHVSFHRFYSLTSKLNKKHEWGTNSSYITSGLVSYPQGKVMDMIKLRSSSLENIEDIILNNHLAQNITEKKTLEKNHERVMIIGGGKSIHQHINYIKMFLKQNADIQLIFATSKHLDLFKDFFERSYLVLVSDEIKRYKSLSKISNMKFCYFENDKSVLLPKNMENIYMIPDSIFINKIYSRSELALALAKMTKSEKCFLIGFDGYINTSYKENILMMENQSIFNQYGSELSICSLLPTSYNIHVESLFSKFVL